MIDLPSQVKPMRRLAAAISSIALLILIALGIAVAQEKSAKNSPHLPQSEAARAKTLAHQQIIVNTDLVTLNVTVTNADGFHVPGLTKQDFVLTDNKIPQEITFFSDADVPLSVGIVFDVSGSMSGEKIESAQTALTNFMQTSHPDDEYFLIGFSSQPQLLLDRTRDANAVINKLSVVEPNGSTALYDATYLALDCVARGVYPKRAILVISDGQDNNSRYTFSNLQRALKESGVILYAIGIEGGTIGTLEVYGKLLLSELASVSGGRVFFPRNADQMHQALEQIALELRHQYSIGYRPSNFSLDGKWHRVRVKVISTSGGKRIFIRSRDGYYAIKGSLPDPFQYSNR